MLIDGVIVGFHCDIISCEQAHRGLRPYDEAVILISFNEDNGIQSRYVILKRTSSFITAGLIDIIVVK